MAEHKPDAPENLLRFLRDGKSFIVIGHKEPDGDCVSSQLTLVSALRRMGKQAAACTAGPFKRVEVKPFENRFVPFPQGPEREGLRVIIVDCSSLERIGDLPVKGLPLAIIDHHEPDPNDPERGGCEALYVEPDAPSVTLLVHKVMRALGLELEREEAELLLFGLCTDTGFFRHVDTTGEETFLSAAAFAAAGASPKRTFAAINGGKSLASRILAGRILSRARALFGGRLILSFEDDEDARLYGGESRDSDTIYQLLMTVEGVEAVALLRQEKPDSCTLGLRSRDRIDVASIAALFGGGGHKNAAGASAEGTIAALEGRVITAFERFFT